MNGKVKLSHYRAIIVVFALIAMTRFGLAAFEQSYVDPRSTGIGGAGIALRDDGWAIFRNPALAVKSSSRLGLGWSQQFGIPELSQESIAGNTKIYDENFGITISRFGATLYNETSYGLVYAKEVRKNLSVGVELSGRQLKIESYSTGSAFAATLGMAVSPVKSWTISAVWRNLNRPQVSNYHDKIAESLTVGVATEVVDQSILTLDIIQEKRFKTEFRVGAETQFMKALQIRVGMRGEPIRPSAGFQISVGRWNFNYGGDIHPDLGPSHTLGLDIRLGQ